MKKRIVIVDDHQLVLDGLVRIIKSSETFELVGTACRGQELLELLKKPSPLPDLVLMDIDMPGLNGIEAAKLVKKDFPSVQVVMLTMHEESGFYNKVVAAGARGFIMKNVTQAELLQALDQVCKGSTYFGLGKQTTDGLVVSNTGHIDLTKREIEILKKIALGMTNSEISDELGISIRTVDTHRTNLKRKVGATSIAEIVRFAFLHNLLS